ncbi:glycine--tRNA ligase subunit beta [Desulforhopalus singaporensis]|uniref:Glycine--tRNA ligase beta subunit n=1 Tax=Desulforhopalus singaporensis TaxID=91360 RepID=A0A1H0QMY4_9BACT|nr:glycine--tRNA ligase subunit beta [Desulforhopalus singaporensis]SDP18723.1 glycyl-tRNA synthetase beta chain [Desulforhopalus singaporensis]
MRDLLFEIGTEEIPAGFMNIAYDQLAKGFSSRAAELKIGHGSINVTGTPRRLALMVKDVSEKQEDMRQELLGPSKKAAYDNEGNLTKAAEGFARSKGADVHELKVVDTPKGEYMMLIREVTGKPTGDLLPELLLALLNDLSFPKSMRWGSLNVTFARPVQWLVALFGEDVVSLEFAGVQSSTKSRGHRFHANQWIEIDNPQSYREKLLANQVMVDHEVRRQKVIEEIEAAVARTEELAGGRVFIDQDLVDTVNNLVENPVGVCGTFEKKFLELVPEVLITSMKEHQKYFPVVDDRGNLMPGFVAVNNTTVNDPQITRMGHQRVLKARLEDALFFFNSDKEVSLESRVNKLDGIIFQAKLGTMREKKDRLAKLARILAEKVDGSLTEDCCRAAELCKADLISEMVGEFPSLQGTMGSAYALNDGEKEAVALGIKEHYMPKRAGAEVPTSDVGAILGLADRFDTLAGCFGIGQIPTGKADPFGLRRITLAILHIIEEKNYSLLLEEICSKALALYGSKVNGSADTVDAIMKFIRDRFVNDSVAGGAEAAAVEAAVSVAFNDVNDCIKRTDAISQIRKDAGFEVLSAAYKRVKNIIKDNKSTEIDADLFESEAETQLHELTREVNLEMGALVAKQKYFGALQAMLKMKEPVDTFFDKVMVMADDEAVRQNRLNLLTALGELFLMVGDISRFQD